MNGSLCGGSDHHANSRLLTLPVCFNKHWLGTKQKQIRSLSLWNSNMGFTAAPVWFISFDSQFLQASSETLHNRTTVPRDTGERAYSKSCTNNNTELSNHDVQTCCYGRYMLFIVWREQIKSQGKQIRVDRGINVYLKRNHNKSLQ